MGAIEHLTISLPAEMVDKVRNSVAAGEYPDIDAAVAQAVRDWEPHEEVHSPAEIDDFVRREVIPALRRCDQDPSRVISLDQLRVQLGIARDSREQGRC